jgi:5-hydroxyisourate hydrolase-like protein (transthyretin family)
MSQITTHILDTALGSPAVGVTITLYHSVAREWAKVGSGQTMQTAAYQIYVAKMPYLRREHTVCISP